MRTIDADGLGVGRCNPDVMLDPAYAAGRNALLGIINSAPTIDPIHAAGGRYCRECRYYDEFDCPASSNGYTYLWVKYCGYGKPREAQDDG